jgi:hypothetical protein
MKKQQSILEFPATAFSFQDGMLYIAQGNDILRVPGWAIDAFVYKLREVQDDAEK